MIRRLRPLLPSDVLAKMYAEPHDHRRWGGPGGHLERVEATIALADAAIPLAERQLLADLSCGNGEIVQRLIAADTVACFGDLAPGYVLQGPIELTICQIPIVDVFVCSETIEHLDDPLAMLSAIRSKARRLVLSTPVGCWDDDNLEHLWAWDRDGVEEYLEVTGWTPDAYTEVDGTVVQFPGPYVFGIWVCS